MLSNFAFNLYLRRYITAAELELLVCGCEDLDLAALQRVTKYDGGFGPHHPAVLNFWAVVRDMPAGPGGCPGGARVTRYDLVILSTR